MCRVDGALRPLWRCVEGVERVELVVLDMVVVFGVDVCENVSKGGAG